MDKDEFVELKPGESAFGIKNIGNVKVSINKPRDRISVITRKGEEIVTFSVTNED